MKIKMLKTTTGASDGIHIEKYMEGGVYDVTASLRKNFVIDQGIAKDVTEVEKKMVTEYENKEAKKANETKTPKEKEKKKTGRKNINKDTVLKELGIE